MGVEAAVRKGSSLPAAPEGFEAAVEDVRPCAAPDVRDVDRLRSWRIDSPLFVGEENRRIGRTVRVLEFFWGKSREGRGKCDSDEKAYCSDLTSTSNELQMRDATRLSFPHKLILLRLARLKVMGKKAKNDIFISRSYAINILKEAWKVEKKRIYKITLCTERNSRSHYMCPDGIAQPSVKDLYWRCEATKVQNMLLKVAFSKRRVSQGGRRFQEEIFQHMNVPIPLELAMLVEQRLLDSTAQHSAHSSTGGPRQQRPGFKLMKFFEEHSMNEVLQSCKLMKDWIW
ncbi:unnamed protein product [Linum tenue]|uniref:Uncharacterized protein n=1 Tax=Linum tenue TaxID=586396 RepID=A0AAV0KTX7_9ROSI|nr:unnamed protein product [Linum tenue]